MATSGSKSVTVTNWDTLKFSWSTKSQSQVTNTSVISWKLELVATAYGRISSGGSGAWKVTIDGKEYTGTANVGIANNTTKTLASGETTVSHGSDGAKTFTYSFSQYFGITFSGEWIATVSGSGSGDLNRIARKSTLAASNGTLGVAQTLTVTRQATNLTHTITYKCGSASGTIATKSSNTSISWTPPMTLASQNTTGTSVSVVFTITTYSGSTQIGSNTTTISCAIPASVVPSISWVLDDVTGYDNTYGNPVQSLSKMNVKVTATQAYGSEIAAYEIVVNRAKYNTAEVTTDVLMYSGVQRITAKVTDRRGRSASIYYDMTVLPYSAPNVTALGVHRCNADGTSNDQGDYVQVVFSASVAPVNNLNTANYTLRYKKTTASSWEEMAFQALAGTYTVTDFDYLFPADGNSAYNVEIVAQDRHSTGSRSTSASTAFALMNFHQGGKGIGFGKVATRSDAFELGMKTYDEFDSLIGNGLAVYTSEGIDPNTTLESLVLTNKNTPTTAFWYVSTQFYHTKSDSSNRVQLALPYQATGSIYTRMYYNGVWQPWTETPAKTGDYNDGIWRVRTWTDGRVELEGVYNISNMDCKTALGSLFRTNVFTPGSFPMEIEEPIVTASYESAGYGALLWATTETTGWSLPYYYLIRPTSVTIASGKVNLHVTGYRA